MKSELREFLLVVKARMPGHESDHIEKFSIIICDYLDAQDEKLATYEAFIGSLESEASLYSHEVFAVNLYRRISEFLK